MNSEVIKLYKQKVPLKHIAIMCGLTYSQVHRIIYITSDYRKSNELKQSQIDMIIELRKQKKKLKQISKETGLSVNQIKYAIYIKNRRESWIKTYKKNVY